MDANAVLEIIKRNIVARAFQVVRVDIRGDEGPWSLGASKKGVDATCAGADVQACEFTPGLTIGGGVQKGLEP